MSLTETEWREQPGPPLTVLEQELPLVEFAIIDEPDGCLRLEAREPVSIAVTLWAFILAGLGLVAGLSYGLTHTVGAGGASPAELLGWIVLIGCIAIGLGGAWSGVVMLRTVTAIRIDPARRRIEFHHLAGEAWEVRPHELRCIRFGLKLAPNVRCLASLELVPHVGRPRPLMAPFRAADPAGATLLALAEQVAQRLQLPLELDLDPACRAPGLGELAASDELLDALDRLRARGGSTTL
ncbi:MAG: hypothetical protein WD009_09945 [Phycisphaeraceae bacterium]